MRKITDEELIDQYLKGDEKSLESLIERYIRPIYNFAYRYVGNVPDAEDITQKVFIKLWRNAKKFDRKRNFKTWIFSIAKNASIDQLKKKKEVPFSDFDSDSGSNVIIDTVADLTPLPSELYEKTDNVRKIQQLLEKLSPKYRLVLFLRYNDHFTFREIAESLNEPLHTIKSRHRRAIIILKAKLKDLN